MRRVICFLLVMVLSLSLVCPALAAATPSISNRPVVTPSGETPKTGDVIMTYVIVMILSLIALAVVFLLRKKFVS